MGLTQTIAPTAEPLTLVDALSQSRITETSENTLLEAKLAAAREAVEIFLNRQLMSATWALKLDRFPSGSDDPAEYVDGIRVYSGGNQTIRLPRPPLSSISSFAYIDTAGATQTLTLTTDYIIDTASQPGRITPAYGTVWPTARNQMNAVTITYVAGYASAALVPAGIKEAIRIKFADLTENRESIVIGDVVNELQHLDWLLWKYRIIEAA